MIALASTAVGLAIAGSVGSTPTPTPVPRAVPRESGPIAALERAVAPRRAVIRRAQLTVGRSADGRQIVATAENGIGTARNGRSNGPLVLAFGCIHGDECAGTRAVDRAWRGCPPYGDGLVTVGNLNPDGRAAGTRLNGRGVDLNRNFAADWRPIGTPGDPEHSGPSPFSEPETRLARRLIRRLRPDITIWFHQQADALVRAWGPSVPAARAYARLARLPFVRLPWIDGTAPNWQNRRFAGTSSFVVELPSAGSVYADREGRAIRELAAAILGAHVLGGGR